MVTSFSRLCSKSLFVAWIFMFVLVMGQDDDVTNLPLDEYITGSLQAEQKMFPGFDNVRRPIRTIKGTYLKDKSHNFQKDCSTIDLVVSRSSETIDYGDYINSSSFCIQGAVVVVDFECSLNETRVQRMLGLITEASRVMMSSTTNCGTNAFYGLKFLHGGLKDEVLVDIRETETSSNENLTALEAVWFETTLGFCTVNSPMVRDVAGDISLPAHWRNATDQVVKTCPWRYDPAKGFDYLATKEWKNVRTMCLLFPFLIILMLAALILLRLLFLYVESKRLRIVVEGLVLHKDKETFYMILTIARCVARRSRLHVAMGHAVQSDADAEIVEDVNQQMLILKKDTFITVDEATHCMQYEKELDRYKRDATGREAARGRQVTKFRLDLETAINDNKFTLRMLAQVESGQADESLDGADTAREFIFTSDMLLKAEATHQAETHSIKQAFNQIDGISDRLFFAQWDFFGSLDDCTEILDDRQRDEVAKMEYEEEFCRQHGFPSMKRLGRFTDDDYIIPTDNPPMLYGPMMFDNLTDTYQMEKDKEEARKVHEEKEKELAEKLNEKAGKQKEKGDNVSKDTEMSRTESVAPQKPPADKK